MACNGCAARREAIKAVARNVGATTKEVLSALRNLTSSPKLGPNPLPVDKLSNEDAGRRAISRRK